MNATENPSAGQGPVLLDIGGDVGALVVTMPPALEGCEVEIRPAGGEPGADHPRHGHVQHVAVVPRPVAGRVRHSVVFPELVAGTYELYRRPAGPVELRVRITGGRVTDAVWPSSASG